MELSLKLLVELAGELSDGSPGSQKFREKLQEEASIEDVSDFLDEALEGADTYHNRALQDIVNNVGQRLGFEVEYGEYQPAGYPRYDGLWRSTDLETEEVHLVVETKKTPGFQISPSQQPGEYMDRLVEEEGFEEKQVYGLIVVGEDGDDIGSVVASVRGSEYRNRIRVITCTRLLRLLEMASEGGLNRKQTAQVLLPMDTVNIGSLVDLIEKIVAGRSPEPPTGEFWERLREEAGVIHQSDGEITIESDDLAGAERLRRVVGISVDSGIINGDDLPYLADGEERCVANSVPKHPSGAEMSREKEVREGVFVECNYSVDKINNKVRHIARYAEQVQRA